MALNEEAREHFWLRDSGLTVGFLSYSDETGTPISTPTITDHGNGWYSFPYTPVTATRLYAVSGSNGATAHNKIQKFQLAEVEKQEIVDETGTIGATSIWAVPASGVMDPGSIGELVTNAAGWSKIAAGEATGEWKVTGTQMKIYSGIDASLLATFNLFGETGLATNQDVFHRDPV